MFVNRDRKSSSFSSINSDDSSSIRRFVQRRTIRKPTLPNCSARLLLGWGVALPTRSFYKGATDDNTTSENFQSSVNVSELNEQQEQHVLVQDDRPHITSISLVPHIAGKGDALDPFNSTPIRLNRWTHSMIQYFIRDLIPDIWPGQSAFRHNDGISRRIELCLGDELHVNALMAVLTARLHHLQGEKHSPKAQFYAGHAYRILRSRIQQDLDNPEGYWTIFAVMELAACEMYQGNIDATELHMKFISHVVSKMGGIQRLGRYIMESILICDLHRSLVLFSAPKITLERQHPLQVPEKSMGRYRIDHDICVRYLGQGLFDDHGAVELSPMLLNIIPKIIYYGQSAHYYLLDFEWQRKDPHWMFMKTQEVLHLLLSIRLASHELTSELCRTALIVWVQHITKSCIAKRINLSLRIRESLLRYRLTSPFSTSRLRFLFWVLSTATFATCDVFPDDHEWFANQLRSIAPMLKSESEDEYREILQQFFYLESRQGDDLTKMLTRIKRSPLPELDEIILSNQFFWGDTRHQDVMAF